jgi:hypothetical protein
VRDVTSFPGRPPPLPDSQQMVRYSLKILLGGVRAGVGKRGLST